MPFLRGSLSFERFRVANFAAEFFDDSHIQAMQGQVAGKVETASEENVHLGFLGGDHLFDQTIELGKNVINDAMHAAVRIDTNQIPPAIRNAWLQMELAGMAQDLPNGKLTKAHRTEAKEAVEQRCQAEAATGKYRKMSASSWLWDLHRETLYFAGSSNAASLCADLIERVFEVELRRLTAGAIAIEWAKEAGRFDELDDLMPAGFIETQTIAQLPWTNEHSRAPDFLGNEFLLWLWWYLDQQADTLTLLDHSEVTVMLTKTLSLECPLGESGKDVIASESPVKLPEAMHALRSGKLPRKMGMTLVRDDLRFECVLQAETFAISGAKIATTDDESMESEERIAAIGQMTDTIDGMFLRFCERRTSDAWPQDLGQIRQWLQDGRAKEQRAA